MERTYSVCFKDKRGVNQWEVELTFDEAIINGAKNGIEQNRIAIRRRYGNAVKGLYGYALSKRITWRDLTISPVTEPSLFNEQYIH